MNLAGWQISLILAWNQANLLTSEIPVLKQKLSSLTQIEANREHMYEKSYKRKVHNLQRICRMQIQMKDLNIL